jgi:tetratricopeptide (TPR) repeat protein
MRARHVIAGLALAALSGCATPPPPPPDAFPDPVLVQLTSSAEAAFAVGAYDRAARFYGLALARARAADHGREAGRQAYNHAACLLLAQRPAEAQRALPEAAGEFARYRMDLGPVWLLEARAARQLGQTNVAAAAIARVVESGTPNAVQAQAWLLHGQMAADAGDAKEAAAGLRRARHLQDGDPALRAGVAGLAGRLARIEGENRDAALEFDKEASFMQQARRYRDMAAALTRAGEAWSLVPDAAAAALRYYRAARSWQGQGDLVPALQAVERAVAAAEQADDAVLSAQIAALFDELRSSRGVAALPAVAGGAE